MFYGIMKVFRLSRDCMRCADVLKGQQVVVQRLKEQVCMCVGMVCAMVLTMWDEYQRRALGSQ